MSNLLAIGKNSGKDITISLGISLTPGGPLVVNVPVSEIGIMTSYDLKGEDVEIITRSIINGGQTFIEALPKELTVSMKFSRYQSGVEDLAIADRTAKQNGVSPFYQHTIYVKNRNNVIDGYTLQYGKLLNPDFGNYVADQDVTQTLNFKFTNIIGSAGGTGLFTQILNAS